MGNRQKICLGEITRKIGSGATPTGGKESYKDSGIPLIRSQNIYNNGFSFPGLAFIDDSQAEKLNNVIVEANDVLLNITGDSIARSCQAPSRILPARVNQHVAIIRPNTDILFPRYLRFVMVSQEIQEIMLSMASSGATRDALTKEMIGRIAIPVPSLPTQKAIAHILGTLDDKIELLRSMNETLEAMARALFKSWFIDFDPVRKKSEGQPTGLPPEIDALFPDSFEDSELGEIPKGWRAGTLEEAVCELEAGGRPKGGVSQYAEGIPSIGAESIVGLGIFDYGKTKYIPSEYYERMNRGKIKDRDVLLYKDGGKPGMFEPHLTVFGENFPFAECAINEHVYRIRGLGKISQEYLFFYLSSDLVMEEMRIKGTGVAIPGLNSTQVKSLNFLFPKDGTLEKFGSLVEPQITMVLKNCNEQRRLSVIRDSLLPKLISGEIELSDKDITKLLEPTK